MQRLSESSTSQRTNLCVSARHLRKGYADRLVLNDVSFDLARGERVALTGPSGSGKTTLLNCIGGIDRPDSGEIEVNSLRLDQLSSAELALVRRRDMGTIFQFFHLLPTLSVFENIEFPMQLLGTPTRERVQRTNELLNRVGVAHRAHALPSQLSGGEMQRVAIARAIAHRPSLILADEPTGNLDSSNGAAVLKLLQELSDETGTAILLVTHADEVAQICHRTIHLRDGRILSSTTPPASPAS